MPTANTTVEYNSYTRNDACRENIFQPFSPLVYTFSYMANKYSTRVACGQRLGEWGRIGVGSVKNSWNFFNLKKKKVKYFSAPNSNGNIIILLSGFGRLIYIHI